MTAEQIVRDQLVRATSDVPLLPDLEAAVEQGRRRRRHRTAGLAVAAVVVVGVAAGGVHAVTGGDPEPAVPDPPIADAPAPPTDFVAGTDIDTDLADVIAARLPSLPAPDDVYPSDSRTDGPLPDRAFARAEEWQARYTLEGSTLLVVMAAPRPDGLTCPDCAAEEVAGGTLYRQAYTSGDPDAWRLGISFVRPDGSSVSAFESVTAPDEQAATSHRQLSDADLALLVQDPDLHLTTR